MHRVQTIIFCLILSCYDNMKSALWCDDHARLQILRTMVDAGIKPDVISYTTAIKVQSPVNWVILFYKISCTLEGCIFS